MLKNVRIKILDSRIKNNFFIPDYATKGSSGLDLRACISDTKVVFPNKTVLIPTGIAIYIEDPHVTAIILPRSGLGHKEGIVLGNLVGLIDSDYQGQIMVSIWNRSNKVFNITVGIRIAQIVFLPIIRPNFEIVEEFSLSDRQDKNFGHSGLM